MQVAALLRASEMGAVVLALELRRLTASVQVMRRKEVDSWAFQAWRGRMALKVPFWFRRLRLQRVSPVHSVQMMK